VHNVKSQLCKKIENILLHLRNQKEIPKMQNIIVLTVMHYISVLFSQRRTLVSSLRMHYTYILQDDTQAEVV